MGSGVRVLGAEHGMGRVGVSLEFYGRRAGQAYICEGGRCVYVVTEGLVRIDAWREGTLTSMVGTREEQT